MAAIQYNTTIPVSGTDSTAVSLMDRVKNAAVMLRRYRSLRRAERDLLALDNRLLSDIGIERHQIRQYVWQGRRGL